VVNFGNKTFILVGIEAKKISELVNIVFSATTLLQPLALKFYRNFLIPKAQQGPNKSSAKQK
jgi:hypothetical protein